VLDDLGPEGVELWQGEGAWTAVAVGRGGAQQDHLGAALDDPLELHDGLLHDPRGDDGGGEDPVFVVEGPGLEDPLVEGVDHGRGRVRVIAQPLLQHARERREHQRAVKALGVHQLQARGGRAEGLGSAHRFAEDRAAVLALGVADAEVVLHRPWTGHDLEGRVGDVLADRSLDDDLGAALHLDVVDDLLVTLGEELRERLTGLVEVVVGIEDRDVKGHGESLLGRERGSSS
jgi:hypothetical protein